MAFLCRAAQGEGEGRGRGVRVGFGSLGTEGCLGQAKAGFSAAPPPEMNCPDNSPEMK